MKKIVTTAFSLCLSLALAVPSFATDYSISAPSGPEYGKATSIEVIYTADGGAARNEDMSKNAAMIPPAFGSCRHKFSQQRGFSRPRFSGYKM